MPVYEYRALDRAGKNKNGIIDADSPIAARQKLRGSGVFPIELKETSSTPGEPAPDQTSISTFFKRVRPADLLLPPGSSLSCWGQGSH